MIKLESAEDFRWVQGADVDGAHPHGDLERILVGNDILPLRTGRDAKCVRGMDVAALVELWRRRRAVFGRRGDKWTFSRAIDGAALSSVVSVMENESHPLGDSAYNGQFDSFAREKPAEWTELAYVGNVERAVKGVLTPCRLADYGIVPADFAPGRPVVAEKVSALWKWLGDAKFRVALRDGNNICESLSSWGYRPGLTRDDGWNPASSSPRWPALYMQSEWPEGQDEPLPGGYTEWLPCAAESGWTMTRTDDGTACVADGEAEVWEIANISYSAIDGGQYASGEAALLYRHTAGIAAGSPITAPSDGYGFYERVIDRAVTMLGAADWFTYRDPVKGTVRGAMLFVKPVCQIVFAEHGDDTKWEEETTGTAGAGAT